MQIVNKLHSRHKGDNSLPSDDELMTALLEIVADKKHIYIVLDGLDEVEPPSNIIRLMCDFVMRDHNNIHIFLASRVLKEIKDELDTIAADKVKQVELLPNLVQDDIVRCIKNTLENDKGFQKWSSSTKKMISAGLTEKSNGMFQWVYCQLEELRRCVSNSMVKKTLATLPRSLDDTYLRILQRVEDRGYTKYVVRILQVILYSFRFIRMTELVEFLAIELGDNAQFCADDRLPDPNDILQMCGGLITVHHDPENFRGQNKYRTQEAFWTAVSKVPEVNLSHFSVWEYLQSPECRLRHYRYLLLPSYGESVMTHCCLTYVLHICDIENDLSGREKRYPLAGYAARFRFEHLNCIHGQVVPERLMLMALELLRDDPNGLRTWASIADLDNEYPGFRVTEMVDLDTDSGIRGPVGMISRKGDVDIRGKDWVQKHGSAFYYACLTGSVEIVKRFMTPELNIEDFQGGDLGYALAAAIASNSQDLVEYLCSQGANIDNLNRGCRRFAELKAYS